VNLGVLTVLGLGAGCLSGMLGMGGAFLLVPLLTTVAGVSTGSAAAMALMNTLSASLVALPMYLRRGAFHARRAPAAALGALLGSTLGGFVAGLLSATAVTLVFMTAAGGTAAITIWPGEGRAAPDGEARQVTAAAILGLVTGTLGGMVGVGGGLLVVPLAIRLLGMSAVEAIGIALAIGLLTAIGGLGIRLTVAPLPLTMGGALVLGSMLGAPVGATLNSRLPESRVRALTLVLLGLATALMAAKLTA
jgi:uncharacterized protein